MRFKTIQSNNTFNSNNSIGTVFYGVISRSRVQYYNNIDRDGMKLPLLQWLAVAAVIVVVAAVTASPTANAPATAAASAADTAEDDDDGSGGGGLDGVFPYKALQLYNTVAGYLEYIFDIVISPITGK